MIFLTSTKKAQTAAIIKETVSGGGGNGYTNNGGFFYAWCGDPCVWYATNDESQVPKTYQSGGATTRLHGNCGETIKQNCINGSVSQSVANKSLIYLPSLTTIKERLTCVPGLSTTKISTATIYDPATAEGVCVSSRNSKGVELEFAGTQDKTELGCGVADNVITIIAGRGVNLSNKTSKTKIPDGCGTTQNDYEYDFKVTTKISNCSYGFADPKVCEQIGIFSSTGDYILSSAKAGVFQNLPIIELTKETQVSIKTLTTKFAQQDTELTYSEDELTLPNLKYKSTAVTYFGFYVNSDGPYTTSYSREGRAFREKDSGTNTIFYSEKLEKSQITTKSTFITPTLCSPQGDVKNTETVTITKLAGTLLSNTHIFTTTKQIGDNIAVLPTSTTRNAVIAYREFDYSSSNLVTGQSRINGDAEAECFVPGPTGTEFNGSFSFESFTEEYETLDEGTYVTQVPDSPDVITAALPGNPVNIFTQNTEVCGLNCTSTSFIYQEPAKSQGEGQTISCNVPKFKEVTSGFTLKDFYLFGKPINVTISNPPLVTQAPGSMKKQNVQAQGSCYLAEGYAFDQKYTHCFYEASTTYGFHGDIFVKGEYETGFRYIDSLGNTKFGKTFSVKQGKNSIIQNSNLAFAFAGDAYTPFAGKTTMFPSGGKTTFIALATGPDTRDKYSHEGDVHSVLISASSGKKQWEKASWPGYGVFRGVITTDTFRLSFEPATKISENGWGKAAGVIFPPSCKKLKASIYADGGLNIISSKAKPSDAWITTTKSDGFSTSFDDKFSGAYVVRNIPITFVRSSSAVDSLTGYPLHVWSCTSCASSVPYGRFGYPWEVPIESSVSYFERGEMSKIYLHNRNSDLWTNPASKFVWGAGHAAGCD